MLSHSLLALTLFLLGSFGTDAHAGKAEQRAARQRERIQQGVKSGQLNDKEEKRLNAQQDRIVQVEARAAADGNISNKEKQHIHKLRNKASKHIYREKHDAQTR
jgi:hypothetical protein